MGNFTNAIYEIIRKVDEHNKALNLAEKVVLYLAGGAAVHFYTNMRVSDDVDVIMEPFRPAIPEYLEAIWTDENDEKKTLVFDYNYNPTLGLLQEDFDYRAQKIKTIGNIDIHVLHPIDLVITKIARFAANDEQDIEALVKVKAFNINEFERLATDAINVTPGFESARHSIEWVKDIYNEENAK